MGPAAYDVASLLQDARVDVPELMEVALLGHYVRKRGEIDADFEPADFIRLYATLAAQRASKILGIFARLDRATASRNTCDTSRGYGAICNARWRIRRWRCCRHWYSVNVPAPEPGQPPPQIVETTAQCRPLPAPPWCSPQASASGCGR